MHGQSLEYDFLKTCAATRRFLQAEEVDAESDFRLFRRFSSPERESSELDSDSAILNANRKRYNRACAELIDIAHDGATQRCVHAASDMIGQVAGFDKRKEKRSLLIGCAPAVWLHRVRWTLV